MLINQKIKLFLPYFLFVSAIFIGHMAHSQIKNGGDLHIGDYSALYVAAETFDFGSGTVTTSRTKSNYGVLSMSDRSSWAGSSETYFVDGYVRTHSTKAFILPVGQAGIYAPIEVTPSTSEGVDAAYFRSAANSIGTVFEKSISSISSVEYWDINSTGANANISLSWSSSSAISDLTSSSLSDLTIIGWNGSKWLVVPSIVDKYSIRGESSLVSGSISSNAEVDLSTFSAFSLGALLKTTTPEIIQKQIEYITYINKNQFYIDASSRITAIEIYDITGNKVIHQKVGAQYSYNMPFQYEESIYIAMIRFEEGVLKTKKIINSRIIY
jgi:hypothetical protein